MITAEGGHVSSSSPHGHGQHDKQQIIIYIFISIALYNVLELGIHISTTFKRFRGLYCWSFLLATCGIVLNAVGFLLRSLRDRYDLSPYLYCAIILAGWFPMVTGQSLVLYSRLHIVLHSEKLLRFVLIMIIANTIWLGVPLTTLLFLENSPHPVPYLIPYAVFEKIQLTVVFVQEAVISVLYVTETFRILRSQRGLTTGGSRRIMSHLILVNLVVIVLDISILCLEFAHHYDVQTAWKPLVYSIKLKMEFSVLNRLVELSQQVRRSRGLALIDTPQVDATGLPVGALDDSPSGSRSVNDGFYTRAQSRAGHGSKPSQPEVAVTGVEAC
ncbi:hypothetical protein PT974_10125 [Cladobotryum mycophilum]|uniref:DUF7703 domain-containing protein n=1 Tax=Cladobotryum mycophilum TaxID=491253 RepID=A0ABR0S9H9_9HYPO